MDSDKSHVAETARLVGDCRLADGVSIADFVIIDGSASSSGYLSIGQGAEVRTAAVVAGAGVIGIGARIEPGAVVTQDVPPYAIVEGNPARVVGYSAPAGPDRVHAVPVQSTAPPEPGSIPLIGGAMLYRFPEVEDLRGKLTFAEIGGYLPFEVQRFFCVYGVPSSEIRGEHAHRTLHQFLVCVEGQIRISLTDGRDRLEVVLDEPSVGLHLPPFIWSTQFQYEKDSVLLVLCSEPYDPASYIRDYDEYLKLTTP